MVSAEGFVDDGSPVVFAWTESAATSSRHRLELISTVTTTPPFPDAHEFVRSALARRTYDFGPFHLRLALGPTGPQVIELIPYLLGPDGLQCVDAVTGFDTADHVVARLLGHTPAPAHVARVAAGAQLCFWLRTRKRLHADVAFRDIGDIPGFIAAEISADLGNDAASVAGSVQSAQVLTVGASADQALRRARTAAGIICADIEPEPA